MAYYQNAVTERVRVPIGEHQEIALTSFTYNVGVGAFSRSRLLDLLNNSCFIEASNEFRGWIHDSQGVVLPGLVKRRQLEASLFNQDNLVETGCKEHWDE